MTLRPGPSRTENAKPSTNEYQSLAMPALCRGLETGRQRILDLGPALGSNVGFFSHLPCSLFIADLHEALFPSTSNGVIRRRDSFDELLTAELPADNDFDLILAWDLLNYLDRDEMRSLSRHLASVCSPGAVLFALVTTRKVMPNKPAVFRILEPARLSYELESGVRREAPMYKEPELIRAMSEFSVESTFLLRNGMQEYLFTRRTSD